MVRVRQLNEKLFDMYVSSWRRAPSMCNVHLSSHIIRPLVSVHFGGNEIRSFLIPLARLRYGIYRRSVRTVEKKREKKVPAV